LSRLAGKTALITGAASGIGRATAVRFMAEGASVVAADIAEESGREAGNFLPMRLDVTNEEEWRAAIAATEKRFGRLDILVNNAGTGVPKPIVDLGLDEWRRVTAVNLDGVFLGIKHAVPAMRRAGGGAVVNVSSMLAHVATLNASAYCAAKAGVALLTKAAALEMAAAGDAIRVNSIHPGYVETPLLQSRLDADPAKREALVGLTPAGRLGTPEEIAAAILYLASDEARFMTGSNLTIDGGYTAR
jgi:NAD(P)-dependent dehydrogenase (short-subunit alcohol dehydrogenase family)